MLDCGDASTSAVVVDHGIEYAAKPPYKLVRQYVMGDVLGEGSQAKVREALIQHAFQAIQIYHALELESGLARFVGDRKRISIDISARCDAG